ncbi:hypothetical protein R6Q57_009150 [Mikania cordata]
MVLQGVRREVGVHARTLNKILTRNQSNTQASCDSNRSIESSSKKLLSSSDSDSNSLMLEKGVNSLTHDMERGSENYGLSGQLKESIGHTEIEVAAGALLGVEWAKKTNSGTGPTPTEKHRRFQFFRENETGTGTGAKTNSTFTRPKPDSETDKNKVKTGKKT